MKRKLRTDITLSVISNEDLRMLIDKIFPDSIILDSQFNILSMSKCIRKSLGYDEDKLKNSHLSHILYSPELLAPMKEKLNSGYFEKYPVELKNNSGQEVLFKVSGFYLGLISDLNDLIVLKLKNMEEIKKVHSQLEAKNIEMDDFIYHAAHSLRGPLATLKGLIYLAQVTENKSEMEMLTSRMNLFAQKLDDKLSKLVNFAESGKQTEQLPTTSSIAKLGERLGKFIKKENTGHLVSFKECFRNRETKIEKGDWVFAVLRNIATFFMQQERTEGSKIILKGSSDESFVEFEILTKGISLLDDQKMKLEKMVFGYVEILNEPEFASLYAAKKIILKLKGRISFSFQNREDGCVYIVLPKPDCHPNMLDARMKEYNIFQTIL